MYTSSLPLLAPAPKIIDANATSQDVVSTLFVGLALHPIYLLFYQAMERELRHLQDQLRKQGQDFELERQQHEAKARALEQQEKTLVQEKEIEKAWVNKSEVGHKRGREEGAQKERASDAGRESSGEVEASRKGASLPKVNVKSEVDDWRSARTGSGKGNRGEADGREVGGDRRVDLHASGEEADVPSSCGARGASTARDWAVKIEHTDRSAVLTNTSAERLRVVKALLSGWCVRSGPLMSYISWETVPRKFTAGTNGL